MMTNVDSKASGPRIMHSVGETESGKIIRRILRKVAEGEPDSLGDIPTLANPSVVEAIISGAQTL